MALSLDQENYFSEQASRDYMSVSQFKEFAGTTEHLSCEETAWLQLNRIIPKQEGDALLIGSFVDAYYEGTLDEFKSNHPEIISSQGPTKGMLKKDFIGADSIIQRLEKDALFSQYMSGQKQLIMTAVIFGCEWKVKMDAFHPQDKIVDLKVMKDMLPIWSGKRKVDFVHYWGYDIQGAIYQKVVEIVTGYRLPFYLCVATKQATTDFEIIQISQAHLDEALDFVAQNLPRVLQIKNDILTPSRCGICSHCIETKKLENPIQLDDIMPRRFIKESENEGLELMDE